MKKKSYTAPACQATPVRVEGMLASSLLDAGGNNTGILPGDEGYNGEFNSAGGWDIWGE